MVNSTATYSAGAAMLAAPFHGYMPQPTYPVSPNNPSPLNSGGVMAAGELSFRLEFAKSLQRNPVISILQM
jgi:hypothetical protein